MEITKEDLINYIANKNNIEDRLDEIAERKMSVNKMTATYGDDPHGSSAVYDRLAENLVKILDYNILLENELIKDREKLDKVCDIVKEMKDVRFRNVLYGKYIRGKNFDEIAKKENYNVKYCITLNGLALQEFEKIIKKL